MKFSKISWDKDPLKGAGGLSWYERAPSTLTEDEWKLIYKAVWDGVIAEKEYVEWKMYVR